MQRDVHSHRVTALKHICTLCVRVCAPTRLREASLARSGAPPGGPTHIDIARARPLRMSDTRVPLASSHRSYTQLLVVVVVVAADGYGPQWRPLEDCKHAYCGTHTHTRARLALVSRRICACSRACALSLASLQLCLALTRANSRCPPVRRSVFVAGVGVVAAAATWRIYVFVQAPRRALVHVFADLHALSFSSLTFALHRTRAARMACIYDKQTCSY